MNGITSLLIRAALLVVVTMAGAAPAAAQEVVEYIHTDALGSPVVITDASGSVIERTVYEPYGAVVNRPLKDGPGFTGHVTDSETGLSYMQQRYMDPQFGMFLSADPVTAHQQPVEQFNRYRYANGNPYKFTDPDGRTSRQGVRGSSAAQLGRLIRAMVSSDGDAEKADKLYAEAQERQRENDKIVMDTIVAGSRVAPVKDVAEIGSEIVNNGNPVDKGMEVAAGDIASKTVEKAIEVKIGAAAASVAGAVVGKVVGDAAGAGLSAERKVNSTPPRSSGGVNTRDKR
ncbi:RHS repeat domain-containing protein [Stenotrophomonas lactitubi]|uniref:RHS repeat domain-containing protein n=1 Tax=Stenotrophomonas lactitubi TaxID=2045214 RepID=UPI001DCEFE13|nr:RHS repeat-associated core domain-containing protein [Stenotrophomonas lactitubi]CAH0140025.1 tRNA3(Ser)-specific nuclease WapA [Stenotrophomonas lactitubi]CAH0147481.1 tRNA3(Ser)-specific nuclease WapA [Stenotrophomonas lactitubi]CAH0159144.1 tRNA3(Ser)-specific nuclease WapA [Stenotrophomonas lactitubi]CAH0170503.1 tRNA3(Ser)-specific nuclease WapA [Stenotrophomonas lactitubi]